MNYNKRKFIFISILILTLIILIACVTIEINCKEDCITLIQLSNQMPKQMMGYIIITKNNKVIVIDGGTIYDTDNLIKSINNNGGKVDYWFMTHAHDDHVGAFTKIAQDTNIEIDNIYVSLNDYSWYEKYEPSRTEFTKSFIDILNSDRFIDKVKEPKINEKLQIDNLNVEILGIKNPEITDNPGNEQSMVIRFNTRKTSLLILGDIGERGSKKLLSTQKNKLKSDIVQMSHHGQSGATKELYQIISPKICLWPTPEWLWNNDEGNGYNTGPWSIMETRNWMEELGVKENYIEKDGDITIKIR